MPILSTDYARLKDDLEEVFNESARTTVADIVGFQVFKILDEQRETHQEQLLHGMENIQRVAEGQDFPAVSSVQGKCIALLKSSLINGETLKDSVKNLMETLSKQIVKIVQLQRLSERTPFFGEATV